MKKRYHVYVRIVDAHGVPNVTSAGMFASTTAQAAVDAARLTIGVPAELLGIGGEATIHRVYELIQTDDWK